MKKRSKTIKLGKRQATLHYVDERQIEVCLENRTFKVLHRASKDTFFTEKLPYRTFESIKSLLEMLLETQADLRN